MGYENFLFHLASMLTSLQAGRSDRFYLISVTLR
jgi:hypothetical protein